MFTGSGTDDEYAHGHRLVAHLARTSHAPACCRVVISGGSHRPADPCPGTGNSPAHATHVGFDWGTMGLACQQGRRTGEGSTAWVCSTG